ncbi:MULTISPECIES: helix-turn-helix domain-containing protein [unclassified Holdemania]|uniref:helix-turn-helix domain-containing protein n=1 Tax=unclassified Holdemania TaxID=2637685 RepID=UPI000934BC85|nr:MULTISPECIES: helix-turn-helix transcriptional regulator [unclassified Holdemania]
MKSKEMVNLINLRRSADLTKKAMAEKIGVSASYYYKVESGYQNPSYEFLKKFKVKFPDVSVDQVFFNNK